MRGITRRQLEMLTHISAGGSDGDLDFDQLLDKMSWTPSKESAQFMIRAAVEKGHILKLAELQLRRGRRRVCYQLTREGRLALDPRGSLPTPGVSPEASGIPEIDVSSYLPIRG